MTLQPQHQPPQPWTQSQLPPQMSAETDLSRLYELRLNSLMYRGPLVTPLGKLWATRVRAADRHYEEHAARYCYRELADLYAIISSFRDGWNSNVAMGWSVLQNLVADSFFKNPEPVILALTEAREGQARMLTSIGKTWHDIAGTEDNVMRTRILAGLQGAGVIWIEEDAAYQDAQAIDPDTNEPLYNTHTMCENCGMSAPMYPEQQQSCSACGGEMLNTDEPVLGEDGNPDPLYEYDRPPAEGGKIMQEATRQDYRQEVIGMHHMRFDPDAVKWDWSDMKWLSRRYEKSLGDFLADPNLSEDTKSKLISWSRSRRRQKLSWMRGRDGQEQDPLLQMIECDEIWSMVHGRIIHKPVDAEFHLQGATSETADGFPMPEFWRRARMYPGVMFAYNWHPPDADGRWGFYPIPDLYLIKSQLKNLIRLEGLILNLCTQQTTKYLYPEGMMDQKVQRRISSDVPREMIPVDIIGVMKRMTAAGVNVPSNLENLIINLKTEQREQLVKHFEAFTHEVDLIRETLSQGSSQRGGVPDSKTATGQLQVGQALSNREEVQGERTSTFIDGLTERYFMFLQNRHTLPVYYRESSDDVTEENFNSFIIDQHFPEFRSLRFHFTHRTGSARGVDRELLKQQLREAIQTALPVVQDPTQVQALLKRLFATFDDPTLSHAFDNDLSSVAEEAATLTWQVENGQVELAVAGPKMLELLSTFVNAHLTKAGIDKVAQQAAQLPPPAADMTQRASAKKPHSTGKIAYDKQKAQQGGSESAGLAGAGARGGMTNAGGAAAAATRTGAN